MSKINFHLLFFILLILISTIKGVAQMTPMEALSRMSRGINVGRSLELANEGDAGNRFIQESYFLDIKTAGFDAVRIPIQWNNHTGMTAPYAVNEIWLKRVEEVVDWALAQELLVIINSHHDRWILENGNYTAKDNDRFEAIWKQVSEYFQDKSDSLLFEIANEPNQLSVQQINEINASVISTIRNTNPTRIIVYSGNGYTSLSQMKAAAIPDDEYLMATFHSYDPWTFAGEGTGTWGTAANIQAMNDRVAEAAAWSSQNNIPVLLGEFGTVGKCEKKSRLAWFNNYVTACTRNNIAFTAWHDFGDFGFYYPDNAEGERWNNEIKDILIYGHHLAASDLFVNLEGESSFDINWQNNSLELDWNRIERKKDNKEYEVITEISASDANYVDANIIPGVTYTYRVRSRLSSGVEILSLPAERQFLFTFEPNDDLVIAEEAEVEPLIDGLLDDEIWSLADWEELNYATRETIVPSDQRSRFKVLWNGEALFIAIEVFDDIMIPTPFEVPSGTPNTYMWQGDFAEILVGLENNHNTGNQVDQTALYFQTITQETWDSNEIAISNNLHDGIDYQLIDKGNGSWGHEIRIPWASLNGFGGGTSSAADFVKGKRMSFEVLVTDCDIPITDESIFRDRVANWSSQSVNEGHEYTTTNSLYWGNLVLSKEFILGTDGPKPNPLIVFDSNDVVFVNYYSKEVKTSETAYVIYSITGKKVISGTYSGNSLGINFRGVQPGVYIIRIAGDDGNLLSKRFIYR